MRYVSFIWDKFLVWVKHPNADSIIQIDDDEFTKLNEWCLVDSGWAVTETVIYEEKKKEKKKKEARALIEGHMKAHDQTNALFEFVKEFYDIIMTQEQKDASTKWKKAKESWEYINQILEEYRTNGENAVFDSIAPPL